MSFDAYEYIGVAIPGTIPTVTSLLLFPEFQSIIVSNGIQLGGLGLILIICFVVGHVVQALGAIIDRAEDRVNVGIRNMPFSTRRGGVSDHQWERFKRACGEKFGSQTEFEPATWQGLRKEILARLAPSSKVNKFRLDLTVLSFQLAGRTA